MFLVPGRQADVADQGAVEDMVEKTVEKFGRLDGYVSNAAYSDRELMVEAKMEGFTRTIDVSMWGAFYGCRAAAQRMIAPEAELGRLARFDSCCKFAARGDPDPDGDGLQHGQGGDRPHGPHRRH
jgi:NAD(P)-dependent dehydrogenase (short-subunit alcohol dehydrogenase family)